MRVYNIHIKSDKKGGSEMAKKRVNISISTDTQERLLQYGFEKHISGGLSGVIEYIAWQEIKVKNSVMRGQYNFEDIKEPKKGKKG